MLAQASAIVTSTSTPGSMDIDVYTIWLVKGITSNIAENIVTPATVIHVMAALIIIFLPSTCRLARIMVPR